MAVYSGNCGSNTTNAKWTLDTDTGVLDITGSGAMKTYASSSASSASSSNVPWAKYKNYIYKVNIQNGITRIGSRSFLDCSKISSIIIPQSITAIETYAFDGCYRMTTIIFVGSKPILDKYSLRLATYSSQATTATIYSSGWASDDVFTSTVKDSYTTFTYKTTQSCGTSAYWEFDESTGTLRIFGTGTMKDYSSSSLPPWNTYKTSITSVIIDDGILTIGNYAFYQCSTLTSITIPKSVTIIGTYAFYQCSTLTSITIPEGVNTIYTAAFQGCSALTSITFLGTKPTLASTSFMVATSFPVTATVYSNGWASDDVFTSTVKGTRSIFIYKYLDGSDYGGAVTIPVNVNGSWKDATPYANVNGVWKEITVYMNVNGTWKETS